MAKTNSFKILLIIFFIILVSGVFFNKNILTSRIFENMTNLTPGNFPVASTYPILYKDYPLKKKMGVSNNTYEENSKYYPIFGNSYAQITNNVRYWETPNNGLCSPADFCGGLYKNKKDLDIFQTPKPIPFSSPKIRVNYYASHKPKCPEIVD